MAKPHLKYGADWTPGAGASAHIGANSQAFATSHTGASWASRDVAAWVPRRGSADSDLLPELDSLRSRGRDIDRNNGVARGAINTIVDNVVGVGLRLSSRPDYLALGQTKAWAIEWAHKTESLWHSFWGTTACDAGARMTGDELTALNFRAQLLNGDGVALAHWIPGRGDDFATKLQLIESDRLTNPYWRSDLMYLRGGIEIDDFGAPLAYWIRKTHPGDLLIAPNAAFPLWERVPRYTPFGRLRVLHTMDSDRVGSSRGKPVLSAILPLFKQQDRYAAAEIMAAVMNAMIAMTIETPLDQDAIVELFAKDPEAYMKARREHAVRLEGGSMLPLMPGDKATSFIPTRPNAAFGTFMENIFRIMAVGLDMPYELLLKDFSKTNYSSARASMLEAWRAFNRRRHNLGKQWCSPAFGLFMEEAVNDGRIDAPDFYKNRAAYLRCKWIGPGRGWVDPVKEAEAAAIRMDGNMSTLEDECAEQGRDWREVMDQRAVEIDYADQLGIPAAAPTAVRAAIAETPAATENTGAGAPTDPNAGPNPVDENGNPVDENGDPIKPSGPTGY